MQLKRVQASGTYSLSPCVLCLLYASYYILYMCVITYI